MRSWSSRTSCTTPRWARGLEAALAGSRQITFTVVSMTLSLVAVFIPLLFMGGILGRLLREFAVTIAAAILLSGVISLTLTPMLASRFLRPGAERRGRLLTASERAFAWMAAGYRWTLDWSLRHRRAVVCLFVASLAVTAFLFAVVPKGFIPSEDTSRIVGFTEGPQDVSFEAMAELRPRVARIPGLRVSLQVPPLIQISTADGATGWAPVTAEEVSRPANWSSAPIRAPWRWQASTNRR
jgi:HAE1 family hydrophobic/amphiphilic exporter-1